MTVVEQIDLEPHEEARWNERLQQLHANRERREKLETLTPEPKPATDGTEQTGQVNAVPTCKVCGNKLTAAPEATGEMIEIGCKTKGCEKEGLVLHRVPVRVDHVERLARRPTNPGLYDNGVGTWLDETRLAKDKDYRDFFEEIVTRNNSAVDLSTDKGSIDFVARFRDLVNRTAISDASIFSEFDRWREASVSLTDWIFGLAYFDQMLSATPPPDPAVAALTTIQRAVARARLFVRNYLTNFNERRPLGTLLNDAKWGMLCEQVSAVVVEMIETEGPQTPTMIREVIQGCLEIAGLAEKIFLCPVCGEKKLKVKMGEKLAPMQDNGEHTATLRCTACRLTGKIDVPNGAVMDDVYKAFLERQPKARRNRRK